MIFEILGICEKFKYLTCKGRKFYRKQEILTCIEHKNTILQLEITNTEEIYLHELLYEMKIKLLKVNIHNKTYQKFRNRFLQ